MSQDNPFAALLQDVATEKSEEKDEAVSSAIPLEDVFGFTLIEKDAVKRNLVFLSDLAEMFPNRQLDIEILEHALFERLLLENEDQVREVLLYLFDCYSKIEELDEQTRIPVKAIILRNIVTSLKQPDLYTEQNVNQQLYDLMKTDFCEKKAFLKDLYLAFVDDEGGFVCVVLP